MIARLVVADYRCPLPLIMVKNALKTLSVGDQLEVIFSRESAAENFVDFCEQNHCQQIRYQTLSLQRFAIVFQKLE